jgi:predicted esterase
LAGLLLRLDLGSALLMGLGDVDLVKLLPAADWATGPEGELSYRVKVPDLEATIANRLWLDPKSRLPARHDVSLKNADASNTASESFRDFTLGAELPEAQFALPSDVAAVQEEKPAVPPGQLQAGGDAAKTYYVHGPAPGEPPKDGYRLVVVLPGGDGSPAFHPFVKRIQENALGEGCLVVQLIAKEWTPGQFNRVVWPTAKSKVDGMKFTTEEFVDAVIAEISGKHKVDPRRVYTLSWSSGGPAAYAVSLAPSTRVKGSFIAMSVFHAATLPPLAAAKGRAYYLLHSPDDKVCPMALAEKAIAALRENGASAELTTYPGGHGWRGAIFDQIRAGFEWLGNH